MFLISGTMPIQPGSQDQAVAALRPMIEASNAEDGCGIYAFSFDVLDPDLLHFYEEWDTQESMAAHGASAHMAAFGAAMQGFAAGRPSMSTHEVN